MSTLNMVLSKDYSQEILYKGNGIYENRDVEIELEYHSLILYYKNIEKVMPVSNISRIFKDNKTVIIYTKDNKKVQIESNDCDSLFNHIKDRLDLLDNTQKDEEYDEFAKSILYYFGDKDNNKEYDEFAKSVLYFYDK